MLVGIFKYSVVKYTVYIKHSGHINASILAVSTKRTVNMHWLYIQSAETILRCRANK